MSTAIMSAFIEYGDFTSRQTPVLSPPKSTHFRISSNSSSNNCHNMANDRKAVGSPLGFHPNALRRCVSSSAATTTKSSSSPPPPSSKSPLSVAALVGDMSNSLQNLLNNSSSNLLNMNNLANTNGNTTVATTTSAANNQHKKLDRSMSEPVERANSAQQQHRNNQANSSRYKTELCRPYEESGTCKYGDKCQFAHGYNELRTLTRHPKYKTELCRTFHTIGFCPYGPRCHFIHNKNESRKVPNAVTSSSSNINSTTTNTTGNTNNSNSSSPAPRPKALSIGSFNLAGDSNSSPSSLADSPTGGQGFFDDAFTFNSNPSSPTSILNNVFSFDGALTAAAKQPLGRRPALDTNQLVHLYNQRNLSPTELDNEHHRHHRNLYRDGGSATIMGFLSGGSTGSNSSGSGFLDASPPSPSDSLSSDLDSLGLADSPSCTSPLDVSRGLRLPIFGLD